MCYTSSISVVALPGDTDKPVEPLEEADTVVDTVVEGQESETTLPEEEDKIDPDETLPDDSTPEDPPG